MKWPTLITSLKTAAPTVATVLIAWWAHSAKMEELRVERLKIEKELALRTGQVRAMSHQLYE